MIRAENIIHKLSDIISIEGFSFSFTEGKTFCLLGSDELQLTAILKILGGIEKPYSGSVFIDNDDIYSNAVKDGFNIRSKLSYVFSSGGLLSNLSIKENLLLPLNFFYPSMLSEEKNNKIIHWLNEFNISKEILEMRPANIPLRISKLILFVRAYLTSPKIIIYDEPFLNLNYKEREIVKNRILGFKKDEGITQIIKSNSDNYLIKNSDTVLIIDEGKIIESGSLEFIKNSGQSRVVKILDYYS